MKKPLVCLLVLPLLSLVSCGSPTTGTLTTQDAGDQTMSAQEAQMLRDLNAARAKARVCGNKSMPAAAPVLWNGYLARAARGHALDMAVNSYFSHISPTQGGIEPRANAAGYSGWKELGENIVAGESVNTSISAWLASPSHCETLMDATWKEVGLAYLERADSTYKTYLVQDFGRR